MPFDTSKEIEVRIFSGGPRSCVVAWPTDADWRKRANRTRFRQDAVGPDTLKASTIGLEAASLELFERIRKDQGEPFDAVEAEAVLGRLEYTVLDPGDGEEPAVDIQADKVIVRIAALKHREGAKFRNLIHVLKLPKQSHLHAYRLNAADTTLNARGRLETVAPLEAGQLFYDSLTMSHEGYSNGVPIIHKDFVAMKIRDAIKQAEDGLDDPDPET